MRLYLRLTSNNKLVPFDYQRFLVGTFHKWIGSNDIHNDLSLYSLSWLTDGKANNGGLNFRNGSGWFISAADDSLIKTVLRGITLDSTVCFGMDVKEVTIQKTPDFESEHRFSVNSPVLVKKSTDGHQRHLGFEERESDEIMTLILKAKLQKSGINSDGVEVQFDRSYGGAKRKMVTYRGVGNKANLCPVIVHGTSEQIGFAWNVGIGHSTGIGFGALN